VDPTGVVSLVCASASELQKLAPAITLLWVAAVLLVSVIVRGPELAVIVFRIVIVGMAIMAYGTLVAYLAPKVAPC
jgi:energy-coupling factor transporter transmembrane protein EcfT